MIYVDNTQDEQRVSIPRSIASETAPTGPYKPGNGISINDNTISVTGRQETLISGTNIDITENVISVTGITSYTGISSGDVVTALGYVPASGESGPSYSAGTNIDITDNTISVIGITSYTGVTKEEIASALGADPLTGITSGDVTTALGYTPLSAVPETYVTDTELQNAVSGKQDTLISGTNIRTINGQDILGEGNIVISGGTGGTSYSAGANIDLTNDVISVTGITSYSGITKTDVTTALGFTPVSSTTITEIWSGTQNQYDAITAKSSTTLYLVHE